MEIGTKIYSKMHGEGTVVSMVDATKVKVDFNGVEKVMLTAFLKTAPAKAKKAKRVEPIVAPTFDSVVREIQGSREQRSSMFGFAGIFNDIERIAFDNKTGNSHLAGQIVEDARKGKYISLKQAQVVAFFARENNLIK